VSEDSAAVTPAESLEPAAVEQPATEAPVTSPQAPAPESGCPTDCDGFGPELMADWDKEIPNKLDEQYVGNAGVTNAPEFNISSTDVLAASLGVDKDGTTTTLTARPLRLLEKSQARWAWGFQLLASANSKTYTTTLGASYSFVPRWLAPVAGEERIHEIQCELVQELFNKHEDLGVTLDAERCVLDRPPNPNEHVAKTLDAAHDEIDRKRTRRIWLSGFDLVPVFTLGYNVGLFAPDLTKDDQDTLASHQGKVDVQWHIGTYFTATGAVTLARKRADAEPNTPWVSTVQTGATAVFTIPELMGTRHYDDVFLETGFQRGIGLGGGFSYSQCFRSGMGVADCPDARLFETYFGGIVDIRASSKLIPRLQLGGRKFEALVTDEMGMASTANNTAFEAKLLLTFALSNIGKS
jgi:hypothetical protein